MIFSKNVVPSYKIPFTRITLAHITLISHYEEIINLYQYSTFNIQILKYSTKVHYINQLNKQTKGKTYLFESLRPTLT